MFFGCCVAAPGEGCACAWGGIGAGDLVANTSFALLSLFFIGCFGVSTVGAGRSTASLFALFCGCGCGVVVVGVRLKLG